MVYFCVSLCCISWPRLTKKAQMRYFRFSTAGTRKTGLGPWLNNTEVYLSFISNVNVLSCSLLNVCNKNDQIKINGHNCSPFSIFPYIFHRKPCVYENIPEVIFYGTSFTSDRSRLKVISRIHFSKKPSIPLWYNNIKARKVLLRLSQRRFHWLTMSSSGHDI